ncbi:MAG: hypothetical protein WCC84_00235 [Candidatus Cybelea sp.]
MNTTGLVKYAGALAAIALCSACDGAFREAQDDMAVGPSTAALSTTYVGRALSVNGRLVTAARPPLSPLPRYATIVPDRPRNSKKFEYIFNDYDTWASILDYPKSDRQIGEIPGDGGQGCTNVLYGYGKKIFWNVAGDTEITEYTVPKTRIKRLSVSVGMPSSCAMNTSGDLAVGILSAGSGAGDVVIFKNAGGPGTVMTTPLIGEYFDGYDNQGNLFADGYNSADNFELVELPKGSSTFRPITISNTVKFPGSVQWDGKYLTVVDQLAKPNSIYQYTISGTNATLQGTVQLNGAGDCAQTWIVKGAVYCADATNDDGEVFKYPAGGSAIAVFTGSFNFPLGVTVTKK